MKKILTYLAVFSFLLTYSQSSCNCASDLDAMYKLIIKMPSYKDQIKGAKKEEYAILVESLRRSALKEQDNLECLALLSKLLLPIKDGHLSLMQKAEYKITADMLRDAEAMKKYRESTEFKAYPKVSLNLDSLTAALRNKPANEAEGIYNYKDQLQAGVYRTSRKDSLVGVVLNTALPNWEKGQIAFILVEDKPNNFQSLHSFFIEKAFMFFKNEQFKNRTLTAFNWVKDPVKMDYSIIPSTEEKFSFKDAGNSVQYIRLGSFARNPANEKLASGFMESISGKITANHLIVDLRNNGGGNDVVSDPFLKILTEYTKRNKVYVLINRKTMSNAEQFTVKLKKLDNVVVLGENSCGMLAYGSNYGKRDPLACNKYLFYKTDMDYSKYLEYEDIGIAPNIILNADNDWIQQVLEIISTGKAQKNG